MRCPWGAASELESYLCVSGYVSASCRFSLSEEWQLMQMTGSSQAFNLVNRRKVGLGAHGVGCRV